MFKNDQSQQFHHKLQQYSEYHQIPTFKHYFTHHVHQLHENPNSPIFITCKSWKKTIKSCSYMIINIINNIWHSQNTKFESFTHQTHTPMVTNENPIKTPKISYLDIAWHKENSNFNLHSRSNQHSTSNLIKFWSSWVSSSSPFLVHVFQQRDGLMTRFDQVNNLTHHLQVSAIGNFGPSITS